MCLCVCDDAVSGLIYARSSAQVSYWCANGPAREQTFGQPSQSHRHCFGKPGTCGFLVEGLPRCGRLLSDGATNSPVTYISDMVGVVLQARDSQSAKAQRLARPAALSIAVRLMGASAEPGTGGLKGTTDEHETVLSSVARCSAGAAAVRVE